MYSLLIHSRGEQEDGTLCDSVGTGEYLDKNAMALARRFVSSQAVNLRYLPVTKLVLAGFVIDAGPFFRWFNPMKLRMLDFKYGCIDAGFALPAHMNNSVAVSWPENLTQNEKMITFSKVGQQHIKKVYFRRKYPSLDHSERGLKPKIESIATKTWLSTARARSLKAHKCDKEHRQRAGQIRRIRAPSDLTFDLAK